MTVLTRTQRDDGAEGTMPAGPGRSLNRRGPRNQWAIALPAAAVGAVAIGAMAIGALAIGRLAIRSARIGRLEIDELVVRDRKTRR